MPNSKSLKSLGHIDPRLVLTSAHDFVRYVVPDSAGCLAHKPALPIRPQPPRPNRHPPQTKLKNTSLRPRHHSRTLLFLFWLATAPLCDQSLVLVHVLKLVLHQCLRRLELSTCGMRACVCVCACMLACKHSWEQTSAVARMHVWRLWLEC